jgi:hypothetical protein
MATGPRGPSGLAPFYQWKDEQTQCQRQQALGRQPTLKFEFGDVRLGHQALTILYRNHRGQQAAETLEFGVDGKVVRSFACYG